VGIEEPGDPPTPTPPHPPRAHTCITVMVPEGAGLLSGGLLWSSGSGDPNKLIAYQGLLKPQIWKAISRAFAASGHESGR